MIRTQIQLDEQQYSALKRFSDEQGVSMAEAVRRAVDHLLDDSQPSAADRRDRALRLVGKYSSGRGDVAQNHDDYLTEAFSE
jgi:hypothetical protein